MNHLEIKTVKLPNPNNRRRPRYVADIYIDSKKLDDLLTEFEIDYHLKFGATPDDAKRIAGGYYGNDIIPLRTELEAYWKAGKGEKIEICRCAYCDVEGCMSLYVSIVGEGDQVIWQDFENPGQFIDNQWVYSNFGPFKFDKEQYERAIGRR